jgi:hypothetical protein
LRKIESSQRKADCSAWTLRCHTRVLWVLVIMLVAVIISGCGFLKPIETNRVSDGPSAQKKITAPSYHDFDDILIPRAMRVNRKMSSIVERTAMTAGVLSLEGTVGLDELIRFFETNMTKDNWAVVSTLGGPRSMLQFEKENRWCVMTLTDRRYGYKTRVEIWVTPKKDISSSGLLK